MAAGLSQFCPRDRIVKRSYIDIILEIAKNFPEPFWVLYILVVSRCENEPGRYQSPQPVTFEELNNFCLTYKEYLESDGRHHLWIASTVTNQMLVYDRHNVVYIYDDKEAIKSYFKDSSFTEKEVKFPAPPHIHYYHEENDHFETEIFDYWDWRYTPLKEGDEI